MTMSARSVAAGILVLTGFTFAAGTAPTVRERHEVTIDGHVETWSLVWTGPTHAVCAPEDDDWYTCPCSGFAFGEAGPLDAVRSRAAAPDERVALGPLSEADDKPAGPEEAALRRWPVEKQDSLLSAQRPGFAARVRARPLARVMEFDDYDHDGRKTEFLFQVGAVPCGRHAMVLIGITRANPHLHVFATAEHPERPLVLYEPEWRHLPGSGHVRAVTWRCGDHGSDTLEETEVRADDAGLHATVRRYECVGRGRRGRLLETEVL